MYEFIDGRLKKKFNYKIIYLLNRKVVIFGKGNGREKVICFFYIFWVI